MGYATRRSPLSGRPALGHSEGQKGGEEGREHRKKISGFAVTGHPARYPSGTGHVSHIHTISRGAPWRARLGSYGLTIAGGGVAADEVAARPQRFDANYSHVSR